MENITDIIKKRRSVRQYKPDAVPEAILAEIAEAGIYAPSGRNTQTPIILVITDLALRNKLSAANARILGKDCDPFYGAPAVLVVLAKKDCFTAIYDGSLVMENMMLAATEKGLGSCWIHRAKEVFEQPEWRSWLASLGVEGEYVGIGNCIVGYPDGELPIATPRKEKRICFIGRNGNEFR